MAVENDELDVRVKLAGVGVLLVAQFVLDC